MGSRRIKVIAVGLVMGLLLTSGVLFIDLAQHAIHHTHHQAATHGTLVCTWICTAGEVHDGVALQVGAEMTLLALADARVPTGIPLILARKTACRAPPVALT